MTQEEALAQHKINSKHATRESLTVAGIAFAVIGLLYVLQRYVLHDNIGGVPVIWCGFVTIAFAWLSSRFEGLYFFHEIQSLEGDNINEHPLLVMIRACYFIPVWYITSWDVVLAYCAMFPFIHDGGYYSMREKLKPGTYPKKFFAQSKTSTAFLTKYMTPVVRTILFVLAVAYIIYVAVKHG